MAKNSMVQKEKKGELTNTPEQARSAVAYTPRVDIVETPDELVLYADLPGVRPDDLDVRFENDELVLHGRCRPRQESVNFLAAEYGTGDFYRAFTITEAVDAAKISAELKNGVLTLHLPKSERVKPKRIEIKGG